LASPELGRAVIEPSLATGRQSLAEGIKGALAKAARIGFARRGAKSKRPSYATWKGANGK
jgi:hypothetical protein